MPFQGLTAVSKDAYSKLNWHIMTTAYDQATSMLDLSTRNERNAQRLAREVMRLFNNGKRDVSLIASLAADRERTIGSSSDVTGQKGHGRYGKHRLGRP